MKTNPPPAEGRYKKGDKVFYNGIESLFQKYVKDPFYYGNELTCDIVNIEGLFQVFESELSLAPQPPVAEGWEEDFIKEWYSEDSDEDIAEQPQDVLDWISTHKALWEKERDERAVEILEKMMFKWHASAGDLVMLTRLINDAITTIEKGESL